MSPFRSKLPTHFTLKSIFSVHLLLQNNYLQNKDNSEYIELLTLVQRCHGHAVLCMNWWIVHETVHQFSVTGRGHTWGKIRKKVHRALNGKETPETSRQNSNIFRNPCTCTYIKANYAFRLNFRYTYNLSKYILKLRLCQVLYESRYFPYSCSNFQLSIAN